VVPGAAKISMKVLVKRVCRFPQRGRVKTVETTRYL